MTEKRPLVAGTADGTAADLAHGGPSHDRGDNDHPGAALDRVLGGSLPGRCAGMRCGGARRDDLGDLLLGSWVEGREGGQGDCLCLWGEK